MELNQYLDIQLEILAISTSPLRGTNHHAPEWPAQEYQTLYVYTENCNRPGTLSQINAAFLIINLRLVNEAAYAHHVLSTLLQVGALNTGDFTSWTTRITVDLFRARTVTSLGPLQHRASYIDGLRRCTIRVNFTFYLEV